MFPRVKGTNFYDKTTKKFENCTILNLFSKKCQITPLFGLFSFSRNFAKLFQHFECTRVKYKQLPTNLRFHLGGIASQN